MFIIYGLVYIVIAIIAILGVLLLVGFLDFTRVLVIGKSKKELIREVARLKSEELKLRKSRDAWKLSHSDTLKDLRSAQRDLGRVKNQLLDAEKQLFQYQAYGGTGKSGMTEDKLVLEAIKKAMTFSHPDKGGNEEDFHKFHSLYKKYK